VKGSGEGAGAFHFQGSKGCREAAGLLRGMALPPAGMEDAFLAAGPNVRAVYPEYLTDPKIVFCSSDSTDGPHSLETPGLSGTNFGLPCADTKQGLRAVDES